MKSLNINFISKSHKNVLTSEEHLKVIGNMSGITVKNLLVKEKRQKIPYCVVYDAKKSNIDLKLLGKKLVMYFYLILYLMLHGFSKCACNLYNYFCWDLL